jgi:uncharacterized protein with von Willebrand factor type A (vWA) domain
MPRAIEAATLASERAVRNALRPVLNGSREHALIFDRAFDAFFYPTDRSEPPREARSVLSREPRNADLPESQRDSGRPNATAAERCRPPRMWTSRTIGRLGSCAPATAHSAEGPPLDLGPPDAEWRAAARMFVQRMRTRLSGSGGPPHAESGSISAALYDTRPAHRWGGRHFAGARALRRRPRIVVLIDGAA